MKPTKTQKCEWCSAIAVFLLNGMDKPYMRYACSKHKNKIKQLANLDGVIEWYISHDKNGFEV